MCPATSPEGGGGVGPTPGFTDRPVPGVRGHTPGFTTRRGAPGPGGGGGGATPGFQVTLQLETEILRGAIAGEGGAYKAPLAVLREAPPIPT